MHRISYKRRLYGIYPISSISSFSFRCANDRSHFPLAGFSSTLDFCALKLHGKDAGKQYALEVFKHSPQKVLSFRHLCNYSIFFIKSNYISQILSPKAKISLVDGFKPHILKIVLNRLRAILWNSQSISFTLIPAVIFKSSNLKS